MKLTHQILDFQHLAHAEGQTDSHTHRQTFRHSDHNKGHSYHDGLESIIEYLQQIAVVCRISVKREIIDHPSDHNKTRQNIAYPRYQTSQIVQLPVQRSLDRLILHDLESALSLFRIHSYSCNAIHAESLKDDGASEQEVRIIGGFLVSHRLVSILDGIRLSGKRRLVHPELLAGNHPSVSRNLISAFQTHYVTDNDIGLPYGHQPRSRLVGLLSDDLDQSVILYLIEDIEFLISLGFEYEAYSGG